MAAKRQNKGWISIDINAGKSEVKKVKASKKVAAKPPKVGFTKEDVKLIESLEPKVAADLAIHPKKIEEVETWLKNKVVITQSRAPILLLTGPTGCGKTTTLRVLCKELSIDVREWINPIDQDYEIYKGPGQTSRLLEFLTESMYPSLLSKNFSQKKLILIEDFPNVLLSKPQEFEQILDNISYGKSPVVFICTDVNTNSINISKNLFSENVKEKYNICTISFNACSVTMLKAAVKRAQGFVQAHSSIMKVPNAATVDAVITSSMGDLRCAINQYCFASLKGTTDLPTERLRPVTPGTKRKRNQTGSSIKQMSKNESLGLFHGLGRVLNPKRDGDRIRCDFDALIDEFRTQPSNFTAFLHENYFKYFGDIQDVAKAAAILSMTQTLMERWSEQHDTLIFGLWISVLGLMVSNEHKVCKWNQICGPKKWVKKSDYGNARMRDLNVEDYYYYNLITKSDEYHKFAYSK